MCALLLGAALGFGPAHGAFAASAEDVETAALAPGMFRLSDETGLPLPLHDADAALYRKIFSLQSEARWQEADRDIAELHSKLLLGHVLAERYLAEHGYRAKFAELSAWLQRYADLPEAPQIYRIALSRMPSGSKRPHRPEGTAYVAQPNGDVAGDEGAVSEKLSVGDRKHMIEIRREILRKIGDGAYDSAETLLTSKEGQRLLDPGEYDRLRAEIVSGYYFLNEDSQALAIADAMPSRARRVNATLEWAGGLAAWRLGHFESAAAHFARLASADAIDSWTRSAGAYWAARSYMRAGAFDKVEHWFEVGAKYPYTFYGIMARRIAGEPATYNWELPSFTSDDVNEVATVPAGVRALGLVQVGEVARAESELRRVNPSDPAMAHALLAISQRVDMPTLTMQLAEQTTDAQGRHYDAALYPLPSWAPHDGFNVDRALVFALIRQESKFSARAESPAGARGLMQLMPGTARFMAAGTIYGGKRHDLFEPDLNLTLGQNYLAHLMGIDGIGDNLLMIVAAYNGGPGNVARWQRDIHHEDPLLFLESIPNRETRQFVEHVVANYWIYRDQLGEPAPALDAIASGDWPTYKSEDNGPQPAAAKPGVAPNGSAARRPR